MRILCLGRNEDWLLSWSKRPEVERIGIVDLFQEPCPNSFSDMEIFPNVSEALAGFEPDIVTIVTPPSRKTPIDIIDQVATSGYDIFLDKLRPTTAADGDKILEISQRTGKQILIGDFYRFNPLIEASKRMISTGKIGSVEQIVWQCFCKNPIEEPDWMPSYRHVMLEDLSYHHLAVVYFLTGIQFNKVFCTSKQPSWASMRSPSVVALQAEDDSGRSLYYHASWATHGRETSWLGHFRIEGTEGILEGLDDTLRFVSKDGIEEVCLATDPHTNQRHCLVDEYIKIWTTGSRSDLHIGCFQHVLKLIYSAVDSAEKGTVIRVPH